jgi:ABC-type multidrug transport system ATPase subunit
MGAVSSASALLEVDSLGHRVGARWIVEGVTFRVEAGQIATVIGPNGAGKTTLLETIAGLRRAHAGEVRVDGRRLEHFADHARSFAFLPDAGALPAEATVRTLVAHAGARARQPDELRALLDGLHVDKILSKSVAVLSRGEHQRLALFLALAIRRPIVLLDEPFSAFDPLQLRDVLGVVRSVARSSTAIVASVHQLADAEKIADKVLLLAGGHQVAFADPVTLCDEAKSPSASLEEAFVALLSRNDRAP